MKTYTSYIVSGGIGIIYLDDFSASLRDRDPRSELLSSHAHNSDATGFDITPLPSRFRHLTKLSASCQAAATSHQYF